MPQLPKRHLRRASITNKRRHRRMRAAVGWLVREQTLFGQRFGRVQAIHDCTYTIEWAGGSVSDRLFAEVEIVPPWESD